MVSIDITGASQHSCCRGRRREERRERGSAGLSPHLTSLLTDKRSEHCRETETVTSRAQGEISGYSQLSVLA